MDRELEETSISEMLKKRTERIVKERGVAVSQLELFTEGYDRREKLMKLLYEGYTPKFKESFQASGINKFKQSAMYKARQAQCNHAVQKLLLSGRALVLSLDCLHRHPALAQKMHMSPIFNVDKVGSVAGRTVFDASAGKNSLNDGADRERCDEDIPAVPNPSLSDLCNVACGARKRYGRGRRLTGATVDVKAAYEQYFHAGEIPLLFGTQVDLIDEKGESHRVVVAWVGGCFGFTRGGFAYGEIQRFIDHAHNRGQLTRWSYTYVDDGLLICPEDLMGECIQEYQAAVIEVLGKPAIQADKTQVFDGTLEGIGWELDFDQWEVRPRERSRNKLLYRFWCSLPEPDTRMPTKELSSALSAVTHYAQALKVENAFLPSIRKCVCDSKHKPYTQLTSTAQMDFKWIKAIIWYSARHPEMMTKDIDHVATSHCPAYQMETDASTSVGGGGLIYEINDDGSRGRMVRQCVIRWDKLIEQPYIARYVSHFKVVEKEIRVKEERNETSSDLLSINILEFFVIMYMVIENLDLLQGCRIITRCDNTSAVSWTNHMRGSDSSNISISLLRIFALYCHIFSIHITSSHIAGIANKLPDLLSRSTIFNEKDPMPQEEGWIDNRERVCQWRQEATSYRQFLGRIARTTLGRVLNGQEAEHGRELAEDLIQCTGWHG